jgi:outer membrane protein assembly factor BamA
MTWAVVLVAVMAAGGPESVALHAADAARSLQGLETITAIQIQGNTVTPDDDVRRLAGVTVGMPFDAATIDAVAARLRATRQFKTVAVRKRFASIDDPSQIVLVIVVDEGAVRIDMTGSTATPTRVVKSRRPNIMFLPVLGAKTATA